MLSKYGAAHLEKTTSTNAIDLLRSMFFADAGLPPRLQPLYDMGAYALGQGWLAGWGERIG